MPATSPRFSITVDHATHAALQRLAAAQGRPAASIVRECLDSAAPALIAIAEATEQLQAAKRAAQHQVADGLAEVQAELEPHLTGILDHFRAIAALGFDPSEDPQACSTVTGDVPAAPVGGAGPSPVRH